MSLSLADVYAGLGGQKPHPALAAITAQRFVIDSRQVAPGDCFVALPGERSDGHLYIAEAIRRGAVAVLAEHAPADTPARVLRPQQDAAPDHINGAIVFQVENSLQGLQHLAAHWRARLTPRVVGITGSVGKTSTKELIAAILRQRSLVLWSEGNLNNEIGLPLTLLRLQPCHEFAVLEMGFYMEGEIALLCELAHPEIGVITNIGPVHLERAGSMEAIFRGKAELVRALPPHGWAILNWDDEWVRKMAEFSPAPVFRYGLSPEADLWADEIESEGLEGIKFRFHYRPPAGARPAGRPDSIHVHLPLLGRHSVHTALRAAAVGLICGLPWEDIVSGLRDVNAQLRIEVTPGFNGCTLVDDTYNASPPSTIAALNLLADLKGRRVAVLGDMLELGEQEELGHRMVGGRAADVAQVLVAVGPRSLRIAEEAIADGMPPAAVYHVALPTDAIRLLQTIVQPGDYVLVKGSRAVGMEAIVAALSISESARQPEVG